MERDQVFVAMLVGLIIFLSAILILTISRSSPVASYQWSLSTNSSQSWMNIYVGDDGTIYTIQNGAIIAMAADGNVKWRTPIGQYMYIGGGASGDNGSVFLYTGNDLIAISPADQIVWDKPVVAPFISIFVSNGELYTSNNQRIDVYKCSDGSWLGSFSATFWLTMDAQGDIYRGHDDTNVTPLTGDGIGVLEADFSTSGLLWAHNLSDYGIDYRQFVMGKIWTINDSLMLTDGYHLASVSYDGNLLWQTSITPGASLVSVDSDGSMYFLWYDNDHRANFEVIGPGGTQNTISDDGRTAALGDYRAISGHIAYYAKTVPITGSRTLADLDACEVSAVDLQSGNVLWTREIQYSPTMTTLNQSNIDTIMFNPDVYPDMVEMANNATFTLGGYWLGPESPGLKNMSSINIMPDENAIYLNYWSYNYINPFIFNQSTCAYAGGIFALDSMGRLIWSRQTDAYVTSMHAGNGTIYYFTSDGKMTSTSVDLAPGVALVAIFLFFRFFVMGAVSRARTKTNQNRICLLDFIARNPGVTLYETARSLGMNVGTARYHLFILSVNHNIKAYDDGGKSMRYFINRGRYTDDEMRIMAVMKREHMSQIITILLAHPGISNVEISREMAIPESAVSRYLQELSSRGIVEKRRMANSRLCYTLEGQSRKAIEGLKNNGNFYMPETNASQDITETRAIIVNN